jgi:hypothetical protein
VPNPPVVRRGPGAAAGQTALLGDASSAARRPPR